ncbi:MAG: peptidylprolyl isomerase [Verrucomicrobiales bacterium]|nr:peptidylprolyl isomerase [Verrucomicrobiales bacterium]
MMLRYLKLTSLLPAILLLSAQASPRDFNALAAVVNGNVITHSEVKEAIKHTEQMIKLTVSEEDKRKKQLATLKEDALNSLIERELILTEFKKIGGKIREELITQDVNKIINSERFGGDRDKFLKELVKTGMTLKRFKDLREKILTVELMRSRQSRNVLVVTPKQIEQAYQKYGNQFREESFVQLRTLMIPKVAEDATVTKEQQLKHIKDIRKQIVKGESFEQMAKTYSKDSVADKGGDRGTIGEDSIELRRDLKTAAFQLDSGELSDVIEGPFAFYLLKVETKKIGKSKPLADKAVRDTCEKLALLDLRKEVHDRWIARLKKNASIRRFDSQGRLITSTPQAGGSQPVNELPLPDKQPIAKVEEPLPVASPAIQQERGKIFPRILRRTQNLLKID